MKTGSVHELLTETFEEMPALVSGILPKASIVFLGGSPGSFKSFFSLFIMVLGAIGGKQGFLGKTDVRPMRILLFDEESGPRRLKKRIEKIRDGYDLALTAETPMHYCCFSGIKLDRPAKKKKNSLENSIAEKDEPLVSGMIKKHKPDLIVFDTITRFMVGKENSSDDVRNIFANLRPIVEKYRCTMLLLHHPPKRGESLRGSGDFEGMADVVLSLKKKKENTYSLELSKSRDYTDFRKLSFEAYDQDNGTRLIIIEGEEDKMRSAQQNAETEILDYIAAEDIKEFRTVDILTKFKDIGQNTINNALKMLHRRGHISKNTSQEPWKVQSC